MKSIYEKFLDFKSRHKLSNEKIAQIATEYANSSFDFARSYFCSKHEISEHVFYKIRDFAIIFCLVDNDTAKRIQQKSSANYQSNNDKNSAASSIAHFDELIVKRQEFLDGFSKNEILDIAHKYVEGASVKNIALCYDTGEYAIKKLLKKGIVELIFDSTTVSQIHAIVGDSLNETLKKRETNKQNLLYCLKHQISFLKLQTVCYDLYFRNSQSKPSMECLKEELQNAIKMYKETLRL